MSFLDREPWHGYIAPLLRPSGFCARRNLLRARPRLKASNFCLRPSVLTGPEEIGFDGTLRSLFTLYREHPASPYHCMTAASRSQYRYMLAAIVREHGHYQVIMLIWADVLNWHSLWTAPIGIEPERLAGGRQAFFVLKAALSFGRSCGFADCRELLHEIAASGFRAPSK